MNRRDRWDRRILDRARRGRAFLWTGTTLLVIGTGPFVISVVAAGFEGETRSDPACAVILASCTFWPAIFLIAAGLVPGRDKDRS